MLRRALEGTLDVSPHFLTATVFKKASRLYRLRATEMRRALTEGYVFFECVRCLTRCLCTCCTSPKLLVAAHADLQYHADCVRVAAHAGCVRVLIKACGVLRSFMSIPQTDAEAQKRAIASLVSYVSASAYFMCLAGPWVHEDGSSRDDIAWSGRG